MRTAVTTALAVSVVGMAAVILAQDGARPPSAYQTFVLVPYAACVDELLLADLKAGRPMPVDLSPWVRVKDGRLEMKRGTVPGAPMTWGPAPDLPLAGMLLLRDACHYDNNGSYFLRADMYAYFKDRLIPKHKGRIEYFAKAAGAVPADLLGYEAYVWDAADQCWRWPTTLARVPLDHKLATGGVLADPKYRPKASEKTGVLEDLLDRHAAKVQAARTAAQKKPE